jgi:type III pantothenate kinase
MGRLLLVGNSRWHWAERQVDGLRVWHEPGPPAAGSPAPDPWADLEAWACVGRLPAAVQLPPRQRLRLEQVPLQAAPPWLGIDRALAGWQAWRRQGGAVLVADAGTCLSLTWIDAQGRFRGGRLSAGLALQLRSLGQATAQLPQLDGAAAREAVALDAWPTSTASAMAQGCLTACAAAVLQGSRELEAAAEPHRLWLTGGDGERLEPLLRAAGLVPELASDLVLEGLAALTGLS